MNIEEKERLVAFRDISDTAVSRRLRAARRSIGLSQKEIAANIPMSHTTYNTQEVKGRPSTLVMRYLYRNHGIDFNFILHGDFLQLDPKVRDALFSALDESAQSLGHQASLD